MNDDQADKLLERVIRLCGDMLELADLGDAHRTDSGCGLVYGSLRDGAYKVRRLAEKEFQCHMRLKTKD